MPVTVEESANVPDASTVLLFVEGYAQEVVVFIFTNFCTKRCVG